MSRGLKIGGHLDRYVGRLYFASYATAFMVMIGLFLILDMASNLDDYLRTWKDGGTAPIGLVVRYYLLNIPFVFLQVGPFVTLVAGLYTGSRLLKHSEVTAALGAGVGTHRLLAPVFLGSVACGALMFGLRELASTPLGRQRDAAKYVLEHERYDEVYNELWLRDLNQNLVHIGEFRPLAGTPPAPEIRALQTTPLPTNTEHTTIIEADGARYETRNGVTAWWLQNGWVRDVLQNVDKQKVVDRLQGFEFTPGLVLAANRATENPTELSYREARELSRRDPDDRRYRMLMQYDFAFPLSNVVLLCIGLPYLMRRSRGKPIEGVIAGSVLCIFYFATDFVMKNLGLQGELDPYLAAWLPIVAFGSLGIASYVTMDS
ncbi:MAG: LptF/LptG family permease [Planctomycetes bacterium]|nr:LptF/LptG family permease [Planctomycetota bacterium]